MHLLSRGAYCTNLISVLLAVSLSILSCERKTDMSTVEILASMDQPEYQGKPVSPETVNEIRKILSRYQSDVQARIAEVEQIGVLYKNVAIKYLEIDGLMQTIAEKSLSQSTGEPSFFDAEGRNSEDISTSLFHEALALGYIDKGIYGEALRYLEKAIEIYPDNELLHYYSGLCAAKMGKAMIRDEKIRASWFELAERYYTRAIEIYPGYSQALYGLSILLVYEMGRPSEAEPLLTKLLTIESQNTDAYFLLANVYYRTDRYDEAIQQYEMIERISRIPERVEKAIENKKRIMDERYGE